MTNEIVDREIWLDARRTLLEREKALTRLRDEVAAERRALPWVEIAEPYAFQGVEGPRTLRELFGEHPQLLVYHFMFGPDWQEGCVSCSFWADSFDHNVAHLAARNVSFACVSRAPLDKLLAYRERMGWTFPWYSSLGSTFNEDFGVTNPGDEPMPYNFGNTRFPGSEAPGASAFARDGDRVFHTYSTYSRGLDMLNAGYHWLDLAPRGRDEGNLPWSMAWLRRRDRYGADGD